MNNLLRATVTHLVGWSVLILLGSFAAAGCAQPVESIDRAPLDSSQDQMAIAGNYRAEAMALKEKAAAVAESEAIRHQRLFGPQSDWVSGAQQLSQYYAVAAQDLERRAQAFEEAARTGKSPRRR